MSPRDSQRSRVYAAEEFVRTLFDRAAQHNSRSIEFFGETITLPPEARFASVESVQRYVDDVLALPSVAAIAPGTGPVLVRARRSATAAHYQDDGVIAVPDRL
ncbi:MAG: TIGR04338 family metallohydrolase, partial [Mycobacterium sp.]